MILTPVVGAFERIARLPRFASVTLAMLLAISSVSVVGWVVSAQILQTAEQLPAYRENIREKIMAITKRGKLSQTAASVQKLGQDISGAAGIAAAESPARPGKVAKPAQPMTVHVEESSNAMDYLHNFVRAIVEPAGQVGFVVILTIFMLTNREDVRNRLFR